MKKWCIASAPLRTAPTETATKVLTLPPYATVEVLASVKPAALSWEQVVFRTAARDYTGFVYSSLLEEIVGQQEDAVKIEDELLPHYASARQYIKVNGKLKYNLCGEFCVAHIMGDSIGRFLDRWKNSKPSHYAVVVGQDKTTGFDMISSMLSSYPITVATKPLAVGLTDPIIGVRQSPGRLSNLLKDWKLIMGCNISPVDGYLIGSGIKHWIVVRSVQPYSVNKAVVEIYNPFMNQIETYSWREFLLSTAPSTSGLLIRPD